MFCLDLYLLPFTPALSASYKNLQHFVNVMEEKGLRLAQPAPEIAAPVESDDEDAQAQEKMERDDGVGLTQWKDESERKRLLPH